MPPIFSGPAAVTVTAYYLRQRPVELTTFDCAVRLIAESQGRIRVELDRYLLGPSAATSLRVALPDGHAMQGKIIDGCNEPGGGWLLIDVEHDLALKPPASKGGAAYV